MSHLQRVYNRLWTENVCYKINWKLCVQNVNNLQWKSSFVQLLRRDIKALLFHYIINANNAH